MPDNKFPNYRLGLNESEANDNIRRKFFLKLVFLILIVLVLAGGFFLFLKYKTELYLAYYKNKTISPVIIDGVEFPKEEARHGGAGKYEWWYLPFYLYDKADPKNKFNVMVTFHRDGLGPQFFIADIKNQKKYFKVIPNETKSLSSQKLFLRSLDNFLIETSLFEYKLRCQRQNIGLDLNLKSIKDPIFRSRDDKGRNLHIMQSRVAVSGSIKLDGKKHKVEGWAWLCHQSPFDATLGKILGWKVWYVQLDNNTELVFGNVFLLGKEESVGEIFIFDENSSGLNFKKLPKEDFILEELDWWKSEEFNRAYPTSWTLDIPSENINLKIEAILKNQVVSEVEKNSSYEGVCKVNGTYRDKKVEGWAYNEQYEQAILPIFIQQGESSQDKTKNETK